MLEREATGVFLVDVGKGIAKCLPAGLEFAGFFIDDWLDGVSKGTPKRANKW